MITIVDYKAGNPTSVQRALAAVGIESRISPDPDLVRGAERIIFPGVGAIRDCMAEIRRHGIDTILREAVPTKPVLAICVGMQALMERIDALNQQVLKLGGVGVSSSIRAAPWPATAVEAAPAGASPPGCSP